MSEVLLFYLALNSAFAANAFLFSFVANVFVISFKSNLLTNFFCVFFASSELIIIRSSKTFIFHF